MINSDVVLVVPPVLTVVRPLIGPSLLKAQLSRKNISCCIHYANIDYAEQIGAEQNEWLSNFASTNWLMSEWIFSNAAFPEHHRNNAHAYFEEVIGDDYPKPLANRLCELGNSAEAFVRNQVEKIMEFSPKIVGFSSSFEQTTSSIAISKALKEINPEIVIVFGGSNCMGKMGHGLLNTFDVIDYPTNGFKPPALSRSALAKE